MSKLFNGVKLAGDVGELKAGGFVLTVVNTTQRDTYTEKIPVQLSKKNQPSWLEDGCKVVLEGQLSFKLQNGVELDYITCDPESLVQAGDEDPYMNVCRLIGHIAGQYYRPKSPEGKEPVNNVTIQLAKNFFKAVLFDPLAVTFHRLAKKGIEAQIQGALQNSEFKRRDGTLVKALEIRADPDWTELRQSAESLDPFANFGGTKQAPAADQGPAF